MKAREELHNEGYTKDEINADLTEIERSAVEEAHSTPSNENETKAAEAVDEYFPEKVDETQTPINELPGTPQDFNLSDNQPVTQNTMKTTEKKGERLSDVEKQNTDELRDRLSGEKAKRELEEGEYGKDNKIFNKERADKAREILKKKLSQLNVGLDPEMISAGIDLAGYHVEAGARKFTDQAKGDKRGSFWVLLSLFIQEFIDLAEPH